MNGEWKHSIRGTGFTVTYLYVLYVKSGEGNGTPLQYSCLENPMDGGAWWAAAHGVEKSRTRLRDFTFTFHFYALEKEMATHSSVLAWRIPGTGEPGGLPSMGSHRVGHDQSDLAAADAKRNLLDSMTTFPPRSFQKSRTFPSMRSRVSPPWLESTSGTSFTAKRQHPTSEKKLDAQK